MKNELPQQFLDALDVMEMHNKSRSWAYRRLSTIRNAYQLKSHQRVSLYQFCDFEGLPQDEVMKMLSQGRRSL